MRRDKGTGEQPHWIESQGRWRARYLDADGRRRSVYSAKPGRSGQRECGARRDKALDLSRRGLLAADGEQRLGEYLDGWLKTAKRDLRARSFEKYAGIVRLHISPRVGTIPIARLRPQRIADFYDELLDDGRSPATVRYVHAVLHRALQQAVSWRILGINPSDAVRAPRAARSEVQPFTPAQTQQLVEGIAGDGLEVLVILALRTAMRLGELLGLRWSDVDPDRQTIKVQRELYRHKGEWMTDDPKSGQRRSIRVETDTIGMLRSYRIERAEHFLAIGHRVTEDDLVFMTDEGEPFDGHHLTERRFRPLLARLELPQRRFHDLRHTAATLMLGAGMNAKVVSEMLGHSTVEMTLNIYAHVLPTMQAEAAAALEALTVRSSR